jgi:hypothetical protein
VPALVTHNTASYVYTQNIIWDTSSGYPDVQGKIIFNWILEKTGNCEIFKP